MMPASSTSMSVLDLDSEETEETYSEEELTSLYVDAKYRTIQLQSKIMFFNAIVCFDGNIDTSVWDLRN